MSESEPTNEIILTPSASAEAETKSRAWKDRVPKGVATVVDRALDAADEVADEIRRGVDGVARAVRDATRDATK